MEEPVFCDTSLLRVAYLSGGSEGGSPVLLIHGWPDDATTFADVAPSLQAAGFRTFAPWLRGFGKTSFHSDKTMRSGEIAAMAQDALDFADAIGLERFAVVGHDWGARIAYLLASVFPQRITCCAALSLGWQPGPPPTPPLKQARAFWYQWFMATERGEEFVRQHGHSFARFQWDSWSPRRLVRRRAVRTGREVLRKSRLAGRDAAFLSRALGRGGSRPELC
ncbi:alpha/beta fold hydrolase [Mesorhizobium atlanticum]